MYVKGDRLQLHKLSGLHYVGNYFNTLLVAEVLIVNIIFVEQCRQIFNSANYS